MDELASSASRLRSMPAAAIEAILAGPGIHATQSRPRRTLGFRERLRADRRARPSFAGAKVVVHEGLARVRCKRSWRRSPASSSTRYALATGSRMASPLTAHPHGERHLQRVRSTRTPWPLFEALRDVDPLGSSRLPCGDGDEDS